MANDSGAAQNKLGELFVEFGAKGLGGLLKGLNGVSAQFLLTKTAATEAVKMFTGLSKVASNSVIGFDKIAAASSFTTEELQRLSRWAKVNSIDFNSFIGQTVALEQALRKFKIGDASSLKGFQLLKLDPQELEKLGPLEALKRINEAIKDLDDVDKTMALNYLGLNEEMIFAMGKANRGIDDTINLTAEENNELRKQKDAWNDLKDASDQAGSVLVGHITEISDVTIFATKKLKDLIHFIQANKEQKIDIVIDFIYDTLKNLKHFIKGSMLPNPKEEEKTVFRKYGEWFTASAISLTKDIMKGTERRKNRINTIKPPSQSYKPQIQEGLDTLPPLVNAQGIPLETSKPNKNVTINLEQNIKLESIDDMTTLGLNLDQQQRNIVRDTSGVFE